MADVTKLSDADLQTFAKMGAGRLIRLLELDAPSVVLNNEYVMLGKRIAEIMRRQDETTQGGNGGRVP